MKVSAHIGIKENKESDRAAKQATDVPGMNKRLLSDHQEI